VNGEVIFSKTTPSALVFNHKSTAEREATIASQPELVDISGRQIPHGKTPDQHKSKPTTRKKNLDYDV
jgi:hypothetical protein